MLGFPEHIIMASVFSPRKRNRMFLEHKDYMVLIGPLLREEGHTNKVSHSIQRK